MIAQNLPILQVVVPLLGAPLCVVIRNARLVAAFAFSVGWAAFGISAALMSRVLDSGPISYEIGGWASHWGIEYRIDTLAAFLLVIVSGVGALVLSFSARSVAAEVPRDRQYLFFAAFLLCMTGLLGIAITGDIFNVFVFLEISSLSAYVLISMGSERRALTASYRYLVMGTIGSTFILIGVGLIYMMTGTLNMADLAERLHDRVTINGVSHIASSTRTVVTAFAFLMVGISIKLALFPLHVWLPNAYTYAPNVVTAFLAATATKVSFYLMLRVIFTIFGGPYVFNQMDFDAVLMVTAIAAIYGGSLVAIYQTNVKRLLAYSSVAQIGYMVLGLSFANGTDAGSIDGLTAGIVHLFNHAMMKGGLFLATGCVAYRLGAVTFDDIRGIGKRMPLTAAAMVLGGLNLIGVPLTSGFVTKWYLILAALEKGLWAVAASALVSSLLAVVYVWRIVEAAYFREPTSEFIQPVEGRTDAPWSMLVPMWLILGASVYFGIFTDLPVGIAREAAASLLRINP